MIPWLQKPVPLDIVLMIISAQFFFQIITLVPWNIPIYSTYTRDLTPSWKFMKQCDWNYYIVASNSLYWIMSPSEKLTLYLELFSDSIMCWCDLVWDQKIAINIRVPLGWYWYQYYMEYLYIFINRSKIEYNLFC